MATHTVDFLPQKRRVRVESGTTLLEAATAARISLNNLCGGDGICGRCKMIVLEGDAGATVSPKLTRDEIRKGYVLACQLPVVDDLVVEVPEETLAREKPVSDRDAERFESAGVEIARTPETGFSPIVGKLFLELAEPSLSDNTAEHQRVVDAVRKVVGSEAVQTGLKIVSSLHRTLRDAGYSVTATVGQRNSTFELMNVEPGDTSDRNYIVVIDMGTTTLVAHLMDARNGETVDATASFNSGAMYGREVTGRMMAAERKGVGQLQSMLVEDLNQLIRRLANENGISPVDISCVACAGNTVMNHFLLGLPTESIRREPYVPVTVEPSPFRAAEVGLEVNPRGLLYLLPGISGWVGSDITAGILATGMHTRDELSLLMDIGTNGEIVVGGSEWMVAASASAGPALEGASEQCGMRAEHGAIERVRLVDDTIEWDAIGGGAPKGICGSGIIDLVATMLDAGIIDRSGAMHSDSQRVRHEDGVGRYLLVGERESSSHREICITEADIEHVIDAKAAIFAAMSILCRRLELEYEDLGHVYIAGSFGNHLDIESATKIGLIPAVDPDRISFVGNTSLQGAKLAAMYAAARHELDGIRRITTYYDLMGAADYVEEFQKARFLPHTDIEAFDPSGHQRSSHAV